jgi:SpoVK/Ycf46/Vps4 family AAA+-type ATPase
MNEARAPDWATANERYVAAAFDRLLLRLGGEAEAVALPPEIEQILAEIPPAIDVVTQAFQLTPFERDILLLCAGTELDPRIADACDRLRGDDPLLTYALVRDVLPEAHWTAIAPVRPLRHWRLLHVGDGISLARSALRIDERVLHFIAGIPYADPHIAAVTRDVDMPDDLPASRAPLARRVGQVWDESPAETPVIVLTAEGGDDAVHVAAAACAALGRGLRLIRGEDLPALPADRDTLARIWEREAALTGASLLIDCRSGGIDGAVRAFGTALRAPLMISTREPSDVDFPRVSIEIPRLDTADRRALWRDALGPAAARMNGRLETIVGAFDLPAELLRTTAASARSAVDRGEDAEIAIRAALRDKARRQVGDLAQRVDARARWDDVVLPAAQKQMLHDIAAQTRQRGRVYEEWGFGTRSARGLGIAVLFAGESGTGKTLAAEAIAGELGLELYRIELSQVVSRYIGDTEKNLGRIFDAAENSGAILLFDEADALFGKRSEVKDSHDRYANIEVSYLLQRMESYRGLAILTTNTKSALDVAFQRRLRFIVDFPFPDATQRAEIWRRVFPAAAPTERLDVAKLARLRVTGGFIANIALNAAFRAAESGSPLRMSHLLQAAGTECAKNDRPLNELEVEGWA